MFDQGTTNSGRFYELALQRVGDGLIIVDPAGRIVWSNEAADRMFNCAPASLAGRSLDDIIPTAHRQNHARDFKTLAKGEESEIFGQGRAVTGRRPDGGTIDLHINVTRMREGGTEYFLAIMRDTSVEREFQRSINFTHNYDFLTQLHNREGFNLAAQRAYEEANAADEPLWLAILNVDGLGKINRWVGYDSGDLVLHEIGARLHREFPEDVVLGRVDGNEFAILTRASRVDDSTQALNAMLGRVGQRIDIGDRHLDFGFTAGIARSDNKDIADGSDALFAAARSALQVARSSPSRSTVIFDEHLGRRERIARNLEEHLVDALARKEFYLVYQPKVDALGHLAGFEALLRWRTAAGEFVSPADFVPVAEANGTIETIGTWVFEESCRAVHALGEAAGKPIRLAVNLSPRQLENPDLPTMLANIAKAENVDPNLIELEVTESWAVKDFEIGSGRLAELKAQGFHLSLDDFGSGYSSLGALIALPVDTIKIDRTLLPGDVAENQNARRLLSAAVDVCRAVECEVLVEGAETEAQLEVIRALGCEYAQGFLISKPLSFDDALAFARG